MKEYCVGIRMLSAAKLRPVEGSCWPIPENVCQKINLGRGAPRSIRQEDFADREAEGVLLVPKAGEMLYHLKKQPKWAGGE